LLGVTVIRLVIMLVRAVVSTVASKQFC